MYSKSVTNQTKRTQMEEIWKDVPGFEGLYQVSNTGKVKSIATKVNHRYGSRKRAEKLKSLATNENGYATVNLYKENKLKVFKVHRLVAQCFIPNPYSKKTVNHIDANKLNNNLPNLEWATHSENLLHAHRNNLINSARGERTISPLTNKDVLAIRMLRSTGTRCKKLSEMFGIHPNNISKIVNRHTWVHI